MATCKDFEDKVSRVCITGKDLVWNIEGSEKSFFSIERGQTSVVLLCSDIPSLKRTLPYFDPAYPYSCNNIELTLEYDEDDILMEKPRVKNIVYPAWYCTYYEPGGKTCLELELDADEKKYFMEVLYGSCALPHLPQPFSISEEDVRAGYGQLTRFLIRKGLTVSTMESITSGMVASLITDTEGASAVLKGAFVTYSNEAKIQQGVPRETIGRFSVYSPETAAAMAEACRKAYNADIGVGITGTAGNEDSSNTGASVPGQVYLAIAESKGTETSAVKVPVTIGTKRYRYKLAVAEELLRMLAAHLQSR